ncbi:MAG: hypothetical protein J6A96_03225 [Clostridia bacterium]|nr:hypothetical protein [Clostridia bacterium]
MFIEMFNFWYFFFMFLQIGAIVGLYFALRKAPPFVQNAVLFGLLALGFIMHFTKFLYAPYGEWVDGHLVVTARGWRDSWFVNICGANIALFPFMFFSKNKYIKDYMFYIGLLTGIIVLFYPQEPIAKGGAAEQMAEFIDIIRFYYHHWMIMAVPLLMILLKKHKLSYKRVWAVPIGLLLLMLFIILNQIFQSELGFIPLRDGTGAGGLNFNVPNYKNTSYIWGPYNIEYPENGEPYLVFDSIGKIFTYFCPDFFTTVPLGEHAGEPKYWPWFWMIFPVFILVTPLSFGLSMIFDHKNFKNDVVWFFKHVKAGGIKDDFKLLWKKIVTMVTAKNPLAKKKVKTTATEEVKEEAEAELIEK